MNVKIGEDWRIEMWWGNILNGFEHGDASFFFFFFPMCVLLQTMCEGMTITHPGRAYRQSSGEWREWSSYDCIWKTGKRKEHQKYPNHVAIW